ncbi:MAG: hypothetical protein ACWGON_06305 [Gemmatimonadota bacterium]
MDHDATLNTSDVGLNDVPDVELVADDLEDPFEQAAPPVPLTLPDTGLAPTLVEDLVLKMMYDRGAMSGQNLRDRLKLPFAIIDEQLTDLQQRRFVEVRGTTGQSRADH